MSILTPAQQRAAEGLLSALPYGCAFALSADPGMGTTTILQHVCAAAGGAFVGLRHFLSQLTYREPMAIEEALWELMDCVLRDHQFAVVDDLHLIRNVTESCSYMRCGLLDLVLTNVLDEVNARGKKVLFSVRPDSEPSPIARRAFVCHLPDFTSLDFQHILRAYHPHAAAGLDCDEIHRYAPMLTVWQLKNACAALGHRGELQTDEFVEYLREQGAVSNVDLEEVQAVDWNDLKGMDDVVAALEAKIALPFENSRLARELQLKPRRGVLLAGPPGTGKTTIGRALAHRLKGKFFVIDGTVIAQTDDFYRRVHRIFDAAARNAPSVIFIDDTDLIFERNGEPNGNSGFYRYLATMLDGLESASSERVCVIMTAMDPGSLPPALLRSGRIELWLETRLPDAAARSAILAAKLVNLPSPIGEACVEVLSIATHGLTGADLKAVIEDGKLSYAQDLALDREPRLAEDYFLEAIDAVRTNRTNYSRRKPAVFSEAVRIGFRLTEKERHGL